MSDLSFNDKQQKLNSNWLQQKKREQSAHETEKSSGKFGSSLAKPCIQTLFPEPVSLHCSAFLFLHVGFLPRQAVPKPLSAAGSYGPKSITSVDNLRFGLCWLAGWHTSGGVGSNAHPEFLGLRMGNRWIPKWVQRLRKRWANCCGIPLHSTFQAEKRTRGRAPRFPERKLPGVWKEPPVGRIRFWPQVGELMPDWESTAIIQVRKWVKP